MHSLLRRVGELKTRGHMFRVRGARINRNLRDSFFTEGGGCMKQTISEGIEAGTIIACKRHADRYINRKGLDGYR